MASRIYEDNFLFEQLKQINVTFEDAPPTTMDVVMRNAIAKVEAENEAKSKAKVSKKGKAKPRL
jgi:hypothetical protein